MTLDKLKPGQSAEIISVGGEGALRQHVLDMGVIPGAVVTLQKLAPMGDPMELKLRGYSLTLRLADASRIEVRPAEARESFVLRDSEDLVSVAPPAHPGFGEGGRYHDKEHAHPLPKGERLRFALVGNQNCGKTTLFNCLTGEKEHVGNYPGITVESAEAPIKSAPNTSLTDLPGIYSLSTYTLEEMVSRRFILDQRPHCIINILDAGNIERNLYLTMQLMELDVPMVLALNMMDEVRSAGGAIRVNAMEEILGLPVVPISAARGEGVDELMEHAFHIARYCEKPAIKDFCDKEEDGGAVHRCLHGIMHLIEGRAIAASLPVRFAASRLVEGDEDIVARLGLSTGEQQSIEGMICLMENSLGFDRNVAMARMRYSFVSKLCAKTVVKPSESKTGERTRRIDKLLTGRITALPLFLLIICSVLYLSIDLLGAPLQDLIASLIDSLSTLCQSAMNAIGVSAPVQSLVVDGIFGGVGTVVSFVPIIVLLFFFLSLLEDSGYMSRVAFVTDTFLRKIGLSGRSVVPLMIGFGCSVPAIMATRSLPSARDRRLTVLLTPFISCSAKIPIYAFSSSMFFPGKGGLVLACMYLTAIVVGVLVGLILKLLGRSGGTAPFVMEMPNYRLPHLGNVAHLLWDKTRDFLRNAFSVILIASIVIWLLQSFDFGLNYVQGEGSMLCTLAGWVSPIFAPMGLDDWRVVTALISGFMAKESVVSTLQVLGAGSFFTPLTAIPMLIFCLLYTPCVATIASIRRELGGRVALTTVLFQCAVAWICALLAFLIFSLVL